MIDVLLDETVTTSAISAKLNLEFSKGYSIQANVGGSLTVGTFKLQSSNDGVNWVDISGSSQARANVITWNVADAFYEYVRVDISTVTGSDNVKIISVKKR